jgi:hypothetical protein
VAHLKLVSAGPFEGIAEPHQSIVVTILGAVEQGVFSDAEADMLIDRVRELSLRLANRR